MIQSVDYSLAVCLFWPRAHHTTNNNTEAQGGGGLMMIDVSGGGRPDRSRCIPILNKRGARTRRIADRLPAYSA